MVNVLAVLLSFYVWLFCRYHLENFNFMSLNIIGVISMVNLMFSDCLLICLFCNVQISEKFEVILRKKHWSFLNSLSSFNFNHFSKSDNVILPIRYNNTWVLVTFQDYKIFAADLVLQFKICPVVCVHNVLGKYIHLNF